MAKCPLLLFKNDIHSKINNIYKAITYYDDLLLSLCYIFCTIINAHRIDNQCLVYYMMSCERGHATHLALGVLLAPH